jgi:hypothetical protein
MSPADDPIEHLVEAQLQRLRNVRAARAAKSEAWRARYSAKTASAEEQRGRRKTKCGARTRRGTACERKALANGRCPNHGGLSTGPKTEAGRQRISEAQHRRWARGEGRRP